MSYEYRYRYVYIHEYFFDFASLEHVSSHLLMLKRNDNIKCRPVQIKKRGGVTRKIAAKLFMFQTIWVYGMVSEAYLADLKVVVQAV